MECLTYSKLHQPLRSSADTTSEGPGLCFRVLELGTNFTNITPTDVNVPIPKRMAITLR